MQHTNPHIDNPSIDWLTIPIQAAYKVLIVTQPSQALYLEQYLFSKHALGSLEGTSEIFVINAERLEPHLRTLKRP